MVPGLEGYEGWVSLETLEGYGCPGWVPPAQGTVTPLWPEHGELGHCPVPHPGQAPQPCLSKGGFTGVGWQSRVLLGVSCHVHHSCCTHTAVPTTLWDTPSAHPFLPHGG